ncbi:extracellular calcium-sensing receptor-like [Pleurodeles waltl]|uniref:extracellular calcium-sensing receptor-like n=1 Tax=Pleurodeles waltl TaxID=8319 RepID=UPI00370958C8
MASAILGPLLEAQLSPDGVQRRPVNGPHEHLPTLMQDEQCQRPKSRLKQEARAMISYGAVLSILSDKMQFPSFLRTAENGNFFAQAYIDLCLHFGWTWIGILASDNDFGLQHGQNLLKDAPKSGICVEFYETLATQVTQKSLSHVVNVIRRSTSRVIVCFTFSPQMISFLKVISAQNIVGKLWIASTSWLSSVFAVKDLWHTLHGTVGFAVYSGEMPKFKEFLYGIHPSKFPNDIYIKQFWEHAFSCQWREDFNRTMTGNERDGKSVCTQKEKLETLDESAYDVNNFRYPYKAYNAIYALAQALHDLKSCIPMHGPFFNRTCADYPHFHSWQLLHYLKNVRTKNSGGKEVFFDKNGDAAPMMDFINWQMTSNDSSRFLKVGTYEANAQKGQKLIINSSAIEWGRELHTIAVSLEPHTLIAGKLIGEVTISLGSSLRLTLFNSYMISAANVIFADNSNIISSANDMQLMLSLSDKSPNKRNMFTTKVPVSICSEPCRQGYRKTAIVGKPRCCYECVLCSEGSITNHTDSADCMKCPDDYWSSILRDKCIPKSIRFLSYEEPLGMILVLMSIFFFLSASCVFGVFVWYRDTPVVKANNRSISYLLLISLMLCFLCPMNFIGRPTKWTCMLQQIIFVVIFSFCISCVLAKTITVVIVFRATQPNSNLKKFLSPTIAYTIVFACTLIPGTIGVAWLTTSPSFPEHSTSPAMKEIFLGCNEGSVGWFYSMLAFMGLLASASFLISFLARKLPDSFNETKFITFSMLVFVSVWLSFIPAYLSTKGRYMIAVEIFAILSSSAGLLFCIFGPKAFIIFWRPERNTREYLSSKSKSSLKNK